MFPHLFGGPAALPTPDQALPGRPDRIFAVPERHEVLGTALEGPWPEGTEVVYLALGCFWGAEKLFWQMPGVVTTAVGYMGGFTPNPTYEESCTGRTGHTETVLVAYDLSRVSAETLLTAFFENHDPTQGMRQGNDVGTHYRSAIYWTTTEQEQVAKAMAAAYQESLTRAGYGAMTTEVRPAAEAGPFWYAEGYHQQYLHKNPHGYCPVHATGVRCGS